MTFYSAPVIASAGITFFVALYHLAVFAQRPKSREYLLFALLCGLIGCYDVLCVGLYNAASAAQGVVWQRLQVVTLAFVSTALIWFFIGFSGRRRRVLVVIASGVNIVFALLAFVVRSPLTWETDHPLVKTVRTVFGVITYYEMQPGVITNLQSLFGLMVSVWLISVCISTMRRSYRMDAILTLVAVGVFTASIMSDTLVSMGIIEFVYTIEYAYLALVLLMTWSLSRKVVEAAIMKDTLEESESLLGAILDNASAAIALFAIDGRCVRANRRFSEMFGYTGDEIANISLDRICGPAEVPMDTCLKSVVSGTTSNHREERLLLRKSNDSFWGDVSLTPVRILASAPVEYLVLLAVDITQRKLAEQELEAEKTRLLVTLCSIGDGVIATTITGQITLMNPVAQSLTGWAESEGVGRRLEEVFVVVDGQTREPVPNPVARVLAPGNDSGVAGQAVLLSRSGRDRVIAHNCAQLRDQNGAVAGVVLVFRDITDKELLERKVANVQRLESLGILAGGIAHDFNNLLTGVFGFIQLAALSAGGNKEVTDTLGEAGTALKRARDFTRQLLTFSKGGEPVKALEELGPLITDSVHFALSGSAVKCEITIPEGLWVCCVDSNQIGQVIDNIVINAQQAMPQGGTLQVSAGNMHNPEGVPVAPGNWVRITICDTGIGIPGHLLDRIFDPFFTTKQKGSGLGLATVHSIVQKHNGYIDVESVMGKGTAFHIYLPAASDNVNDDDTDAFTVHKGHASILVVDDDPMVRLVAQRMLGRAGYTVTTAASGEEALQGVLDRKPGYEHPDLAILDLTIPGGIGGEELAGRLGQHIPGLRCIAISGYNSAPVISHPREHGFCAAVQKPFTVEELTECVWNILNGVAAETKKG